MAEKWSMKGDWLNSCNCDSGCPCLFWSDPTQGHCDAIDVFHINEGEYGTTKLNGLNIVMASKAPGNMWKGNWTVATYFDKNSDAKQKEALEAIFSGKAGGAIGELLKLIGTNLGTKWTEIKADVKNRSAEIPGIMNFRMEPNLGGDQKNAISISNHPMSPGLGTVFMAKATASAYKDHAFKFENTGKDANWATFHFSGP